MKKIPGESRGTSPFGSRLGGLGLGVVWFAFLAVSDPARPLWLRIGYGVTALVFAAGMTAELVMTGKRRHGAAKDLTDERS
ncbi:hypothetical protein [Streptomyces djakartensis]|uniref:Integral membrane protein n=1 Tax=Streptomyces djakartensis TaxID=68193 RepID=A0ABQ2YZX9_9ACTN|nr:hypothetical protein [Streptomyces djakartensis]GGY00846.1 hypothetical protein GCM10010384_00250 [Streptomyces djakartensis]